MLEKTIEKKVVGHAKKLGFWTRKFVSPNNRGVPDRIFVLCGVVVFIEFKAPGKKPTPLQALEMKKMEEAGLRVHVCDSAEQGLVILNGVYDGIPKIIRDQRAS